MLRAIQMNADFFSDERVVALSPLARLLYLGLKFEGGGTHWRPDTFKLRYLPSDNCDIHALCAELVQAGLVALRDDGFAKVV